MNDFKIEGSKEIAKSMLEDVPEYNSNGILPASTVRRYLRKTLQGRTIYNNSIKKNVEVSSTTIGKVFSIPAIRKSLRDGFSKNQHIEAALNLEKLFKSAVLKERNKDKNGSPDIVEVDRLNQKHLLKK